MTRIAVISDIHSNLPSLEATIEDIKKRNIDMVFCLGDIIGKGPLPSECLSLCRGFCDEVVIGNWEDFLINHLNQPKYPIKYYVDNLNEEDINYIKSMPFFIEFYLSGYLVRMFHAHSQNIYYRTYYESSLKHHSSMFLPPHDSKFKKPSDIVVYGDIHYCFRIDYNDKFYRFIYDKSNNSSYENFIDENKKYVKNLKNKILINTGSVGQSFDSIFATYLLLEGKLNSRKNGVFKSEIIRVPYDNHKAAKLALDSTMTDKHFYVEEILTGIFRGFRTFKV